MIGKRVSFLVSGEPAEMFGIVAKRMFYFDGWVVTLHQSYLGDTHIWVLSTEITGIEE